MQLNWQASNLLGKLTNIKKSCVIYFSVSLMEEICELSIKLPTYFLLREKQ